jgi:hypothetical protein
VAEIFAGRYTAHADRPVVVFAIGMRINSLHRVHKWLRPTINTIRMWRYIQSRRPEGYLGGYLFVYWRGLGMLQYWRDFDSLEAFSHDKRQPHLAAWQQLARQTKSDQTFGYWHETYEVAPGTSECIYGSMPRFGLAEATEHVAIDQATEAARARLSRTSH